MLLISNNLGVLPKPFFPEGTGRDYELSPYLADLAEFRDDFTVISGSLTPRCRRWSQHRELLSHGSPWPDQEWLSQHDLA